MVFKQVEHKSGCKKLEILDLESKGIVLSEADLRLSFSHMQNLVFLMMQLKRLIAFTFRISVEICYVSFCF